MLSLAISCFFFSKRIRSLLTSRAVLRLAWITFTCEREILLLIERVLFPIGSGSLLRLLLLLLTGHFQIKRSLPVRILSAHFTRSKATNLHFNKIDLIDRFSRTDTFCV
jgi:hypothetical protein